MCFLSYLKTEVSTTTSVALCCLQSISPCVWSSHTHLRERQSHYSQFTEGSCGSPGTTQLHSLTELGSGWLQLQPLHSSQCGVSAPNYNDTWLTRAQNQSQRVPCEVLNQPVSPPLRSVSSQAFFTIPSLTQNFYRASPVGLFSLHALSPEEFWH